MKKIYHFVRNNLLYLCTLFLLIFIPLYPKLPLFDIRNTWVYVRAEDFVVIFVIALWSFLLFKRRVSFKTPLTLPILIFWIIGAVATIHGVVLIFPEISNVFPNVAFLGFLRHIEYMSLFFISYSAMKDKKLLPAVIFTLVLTFFLVSLYGIGQKYLGFPAYLTMNEEFAKGIPIRLSQLSRVPSTFAGHYDLAAYLVLVIPILASLIFGFKNWFLKFILLTGVILGLVVVFMTVSRVSFFVLFIALFIVLYLQNKKLIIYFLPFVAVLAIFFFSSQSALFSRFGDTVKEVNVLVDAKTGKEIGHIKYVPLENFKNKSISQRRIGENGQIYTEPIKQDENSNASPSSLLSLNRLPPRVPAVSDVNLSTGENLPQGTAYINLALAPVIKKLGYFFYEKSKSSDSQSSEAFVFHGDFLIKKASAYDLSFTTRFQGEWPNTLKIFKRNIFLGSGYGSVSLAVDNNYLRMLGETGALGITAFFAIFLSFGIYIKKILPNVESKTTKSFILGFIAGFTGLALNATLIDVFEASKIAFTLWILAGVILGTLVLYQKEKIDLLGELKNAATSTYAIVFYLVLLTILIFLPMVNNFFVGDDFTWLRWASECTRNAQNNCMSLLDTVANYFTQADGFFYRPGTKIYFLLMHQVFWFNQIAYHAVSIFLHFAVAVLFFFMANKILRDKYLSLFASFLFLLMSGYSEAVFWISATGYLFNAFFALLSILLFMSWEEKRKNIFYILSLISLTLALLFHEIGVIVPVLIILVKLFNEEKINLRKILNLRHALLFVPVLFYLLLRFSAQSHWFNGDYSYNIIKLPFNLVGNILGYFSLTVFGSISMPLYQILRNLLRDNILIAGLLILAIFCIVFFLAKTLRDIDKKELRIVVFGFLFFIISLIPFLGLGNITSRYSYLASLGIIIIFVVLIKKLYLYLEGYGREIALAGITLIVAVFSLWHIIQVQQIYQDWHGAGDKSKNFFTSINGLYSDFWSQGPVDLHFVNVPIRTGEAWVFSVGLKDAMWFAFQNNNLKIYTHSVPKEAFDQGAGGTATSSVFIFKDDGTLKEVFPPKKQIPLETK